MNDITDGVKDFVVSRFNEIVDQSVPVKIFMTTREEMLGMVDERRRKLFERIPESVKDVRIVEIEGIDKCPCAGTHVANTAEIGHMTVTGIVNKGSGKTRFVFELSQGQKI
jgi:misacylated tRNA(Ala) deacylase